MDRREHHRVQLRLPTRLRWTTPFGQKTEVCETLNISRGGVLVPCHENHAEGRSLWVTFPYDAAVPYGQPEISARVVRSLDGVSAAEHVNGNGSTRKVSSGDGLTSSTQTKFAEDASIETSAFYRASGRQTTVTALRFEIGPRYRSNGNGNGHKRAVERRASTRQPLAVPVRVRPERVPWFEEAMTIDSSLEGLRFRSNREYRPGQFLAISFESADSSPWPGATEVLLVVVRVEPETPGPALHVAVCRSQQFSFRF